MDLLTWLLPDRAGVAACGLPIKRGLLNPGDRLVLTQGGLQLPLLWQVRVLWPDGSVKWIFYHTDIPCSEKLILSISPDGVPAGFPAAENKPVLMHNGWKVELCGKTVLVQNDMTYWAGKEIHSEAFSCDELEGGPIAPLFLLQSAGESGITEHLVRLYPSQGAMNVIRRVTLHSKGTQELRYSRMDLFCEGMDVVQPDEFRRTPSRVDKLENGYRIMLWPSDAGPVSLLGGISLRQTLSCGGDRTCTPLLQDGYLAGTRTLGECYFQGNDSERLLFPGFQNAYRNLLDLGTYQSLGHDNAFLGLLHDGDWPLKENQYGAAGYRCYADNEYDAALAYVQGYAAFGKAVYLQTALRCAIHMADIDCNQATGDMYYHGYGERAEDHQVHRSQGDNGHYWSDGLWLGWLMAGDIFCRRSAVALAHFVIQKIGMEATALREQFSICERNLGWPLLSVLAGCEANALSSEGRDFCEAICAYVDRFTAAPDAEFENSGLDAIVWWRTAMQDGCKPFMLGVLMEGLERAHRLYGWESASNALVRIAQYLVLHAFDPFRGAFIYEMNAFGRGHRDIYPAQLNPLVLRGLAYAYELTGKLAFRDTALLAFHACQWTLYDTAFTGKDIALIARNLSAFTAMATHWEHEEKESSSILLPSGGTSFSGTDIPSDFSWNTNRGDVLLHVRLDQGSTDYLNQRAFFHLCGESHNGPAISIVTFYRFLSVRIYDVRRRLVETLDSTLEECLPGGWQEEQSHALRVTWQAPGKASLFLDGKLLDERPLSHLLSGTFTRLYIGRKPGNWIAKGSVILENLTIGE